MRNGERNFLGLAFLIGFFCLPWGSVRCGNLAHQDMSNVIEKITQAQKYRESYLDNFLTEVKIKARYEPSSRFPRNRRECEVSLAVSGGKKYFKYLVMDWLEGATNARISGAEAGYDGDLTRVLYHGAKNGYISQAQEIPGLDEYKIIWWMFTPMVECWYTYDPQYLGDFIRQNCKDTSIRICSDDRGLYSLECDRNDDSRHYKMLFDSQKDLALAHLESIQKTGGQALLDYEYQQTSQGHWFPKRFTNRYIKADKTVDVDSVYELTSVIFQKPEDARFVIQFPPGQRIYDKRSDVTFIVQENQTLLPQDPSGNPNTLHSIVEHMAVPNRFNPDLAVSPSPQNHPSATSAPHDAVHDRPGQSKPAEPSHSISSISSLSIMGFFCVIATTALGGTVWIRAQRRKARK